jgi:hypothetical protein
MSENVFFEFADCVGDALARRWLAECARSDQLAGKGTNRRSLLRHRAPKERQRDPADESAQEPPTRPK